MQASQSTKALDSITSDPPVLRDIGNIRPRDVSSNIATPILFGPIQAARKYLERQRNGHPPVEGSGAVSRAATASAGAAGNAEGDNGASSGGAQVRPEQARLEQARLEQARSVQARSEQDRRLERSLYEGHSIEAGLSFADTCDAGDLEGDELAALTLDNSGPLSRYLGAAPLGIVPDSQRAPDPLAVRDAILRLAREAGAGQARGRTDLSKTGPEETGPEEAGPGETGPEKTKQGTSDLLATSVRRPEAPSAALNGTPAPAPPMSAFAEVARRVWGESRTPEPHSKQILDADLEPHREPNLGPYLGPYLGPNLQQRLEEDRRERQESDVPEDKITLSAVALSRGSQASRIAADGRTADGEGGARHGSERPAQERLAQERLAQERPAQERLAQTAEALAGSRSGRELRDAAVANPLPLSARTHQHERPLWLADTSSSFELHSETLQSRPVAHPPLTSPSLTGESRRTADGLESDGLAHDACNLLSAVTLYSDLLGSPGVLGQDHLHYAEELRLIATRSQSLIGRLLRLVEAEAARGNHGPAALPAPEGSAMERPSFAAAPPIDADAAALSDAQMAGSKMPGREMLRDGDPRREALAPAPIASEALPQEIQPGTRRDAVPSQLSSDDRLVPPAAVDGESGTAAAEPARKEGVVATSLADLLMRWGSLLSTLAHGTLDIVIGPLGASPVPASAEALERILVNLVTNARAATIAGGAIRIAVGGREEAQTELADRSQLPTGGLSPAERSPSWTVLTVDDSGCGMSVAHVNRLLGAGSVAQAGQVPAEAAEDVASAEFRTPVANAFAEQAVEPVKQSETVAPAEPLPPKRQGLGLQVVKQLVAESGGTLAIQSRIGSGTRVEIRWPGATKGDSNANSVAAAEESHPGPTRGLVLEEEVPSQMRIELVAEPEIAAVTELETSLGIKAGHEAGTEAQVAGLSEPYASATAGEPAVTQAAYAHLSDAVSSEPAIGPDGFTEEQLRAMILRLHRTAPRDAGAPERAEGRRAVDGIALNRRGPLPSALGRSSAKEPITAEGLGRHYQDAGYSAELDSVAKGAIA